ncbi:universal stress protein [Streptomyces roseoverticillatus]|uniref:universal stress protein n=1 Tax=Streptomyces roseoverticillatus TaxID=66429 RepID=UPI0027E3CE8D|nr:universal stress protein [Streptomyces roseoverticillatus]
MTTTMEPPLVVGVDGSAGSMQALDWAVDAATRRGVRLRMVYASRWERYESRLPSDDEPSPEVVAEERVIAVAALRAQGRNPALAVEADVLPEEPLNALLEESRHAVALVTGPSGRGTLTGLLLGSVSLSVAARAHCPVVVVRGGEANVRGDHGRIVVGVGDPEEAPAALRFALREAAARGCGVEAVRAWRHPAHQSADHYPLPTDDAIEHEELAGRELIEALREPQREFPDVTVHRTVYEGHARKALIDASATADLLVVGSVRRRRGFGLQLGRVSHTALHHAECPVAVAPQE